MSIQMNLLGGVSSSVITARVVFVSSLSSAATVSAGVEFRTNGQQVTTRSGSQTIEGNWVVPSASFNEWEIRATLDSGATPTTGALDTWQDISVNRVWELSRSVAGISEATLTFDFRRKGGSSPEVTVAGNVLTAEKLDIF